MNVLGVAELQERIPDLNKYLGEEFIIVDVKKKLIVGKIKVLEAPKKLVLQEKYTRKEVKKHG